MKSSPRSLKRALPALEELIARSLERKGFFILFDERLQWITGDGALADHSNAAKVERFAEEHHWRVRVDARNNAVLFLPTDIAA